MRSFIAKVCAHCCPCVRYGDDGDEKETLYQKRPSLYVTPAPATAGKDCRSHSITGEIDFYVPRKDSDCVLLETEIELLSADHSGTGRKCSLPANLSSEKRLSVGSVHRRYSMDGQLETIGELKPELYRRHYSYDDIIATSDILEDCLGVALFTVQYDANKKRIKLHLREVFDLPCIGEDKAYDPIAVLTMLPGEKYTQTTKTVNNCLSPQFDEKFEFPVTSTDEAFGKTLRISIYDSNRQKKHNVIGHALLEIDNSILNSSAMKHYELQLAKESEVLTDRGRVFMSVSHSDDQLVVRVQRASGLKAAANSLIYVKSCLISGGEKVKTKKGTAVENLPADIEFHQNFDFVLPKKFMEDSSVAVTIMQKGKLRHESPIGRVVLGPFFYRKDKTLTQWGKLAFNSDKQVDDWYALTL